MCRVTYTIRVLDTQQLTKWLLSASTSYLLQDIFCNTAVTANIASLQCSFSRWMLTLFTYLAYFFISLWVVERPTPGTVVTDWQICFLLVHCAVALIFKHFNGSDTKECYKVQYVCCNNVSSSCTNNSYTMAVRYFADMNTHARGLKVWGLRVFISVNPKQPWYQLICTTPTQRTFIYKAYFTSIVVYYAIAMVTRWLECYNMFS